MLATASQPEPSAKAPCTRTTFLICCFTVILLRGRDLREPPRRAALDLRSPYTQLGWVSWRNWLNLLFLFVEPSSWRRTNEPAKRFAKGRLIAKSRLKGDLRASRRGPFP